ncbi:DUF397 domain-containing protein [Streptomyces chryseus]|uniref:DUF397 domain-containing protein n=1 Tax=Streptomyces chryseus TaxID=68186 RepID=A0ABQ3EC02_9ACTN|nr:DUF397 domain-containing protein [Streptomyces chryseus]GGX45010.1 hypothetical protein GCM10010353_69760 [Streptomyces chryseus]GHB33144.1 hypothetical protein GCM10010346_65440 [Streptomyces chryseus]
MDHYGIHWIKSSYSGGSGTECVEVAGIGGCTAVRDSKVPHGARLAVRDEAWASFVGAVRCGDVGGAVAGVSSFAEQPSGLPG